MIVTTTCIQPRCDPGVKCSVPALGRRLLTACVGALLFDLACPGMCLNSDCVREECLHVHQYGRYPGSPVQADQSVCLCPLRASRLSGRPFFSATFHTDPDLENRFDPCNQLSSLHLSIYKLQHCHSLRGLHN